MNTPKELDTDHINRNGLDNRKENLRLCTIKQNSYNAKLSKRNSSGYKGVSKTWNGKWRARIRVNDIEKHLGVFFTSKEAAQVYDNAAQKYYGEFANLNFPG